MVAQAAGMDARGDETMPQRVHFHNRRHLRGVTEIVGVGTFGQGRASGWLRCDDARTISVSQILAHEREGQTGEIAAAANASDDHIRVLVGFIELLQRLLANNCLVHENRAQNRSERILQLAVRSRGTLDRL